MNRPPFGCELPLEGPGFDGLADASRCTMNWIPCDRIGQWTFTQRLDDKSPSHANRFTLLSNFTQTHA